MADNVTVEIGRLAGLGHAELRARFRDGYGTDAPMRMSREVLVQAIAYRLQEQTFGGLSSKALVLLAGSSSIDVIQRAKISRRIKPGTRFIREWQGQTICVVASEGGGFDWNGNRYRSLSAIARQVTGTRWSGPAFFGLDRERGR